MRPRRSSPSPLIGIALLALTGACRADSAPPEQPVASGEAQTARPPLGLMGTIPLYWGEAGDFGEVLGGASEAHWARAQLEREFDLRPLDTLDAESLAGIDYLLLAQPRALSAAENVALDAWVRGGGRLLLFADPLLTGESRFAIGDRRRPQDVVLLSPILDHWGLKLRFDEDAQAGPRVIADGAAAIPVDLPGSFAVEAGAAECRLVAEDVLAVCNLGAGRAVVLADAAVLDLHEPAPAAPTALAGLVERSFGDSRENAGERPRGDS
jgi:hypothetical protein